MTIMDVWNIAIISLGKIAYSLEHRKKGKIGKKTIQGGATLPENLDKVLMKLLTLN